MTKNLLTPKAIHHRRKPKHNPCISPLSCRVLSVSSSFFFSYLHLPLPPSLHIYVIAATCLDGLTKYPHQNNNSNTLHSYNSPTKYLLVFYPGHRQHGHAGHDIEHIHFIPQQLIRWDDHDHGHGLHK